MPVIKAGNPKCGILKLQSMCHTLTVTSSLVHNTGINIYLLGVSQETNK